MSKIQTPIVCGMQRSASRLTWQIVKILNDERPPDHDYCLPPGWTKEVDGKTVRFDGSPDPLAFFPLRDHGYWPDVPVIYTYRNPLESFLSLRWKYVSDAYSDHEHVSTKEDALKCALADMALQRRHYNLYRQDQENGRPVLFLRYETYYEQPLQRIRDVSAFMGVNLSAENELAILESTSLSENYKRGVQVWHAMQSEDKSFSQGVHSNTGMQMLHVSPQTRGKPGAWKDHNKAAYDFIMSSDDGACENLRDFAKVLGYNIGGDHG